jgi:hypothetical protein
MGRSRTQHSRKGPSWMMSGGGNIRLGALFCLFALLALIFIPLAHQCHLHALERFDTAPVNQPKGRLSLWAAQTHKAHHPHHDAATCPICQAALAARYFAVTAPSLSLVFSLFVQRFCNNAFTLGVTNQDILVTCPRAPPIPL